MPTSAGPPAYQSAKPCAICDSASGVRRSRPVAATRAMATAWEVSSVHSPRCEVAEPATDHRRHEVGVRRGANS